MKKTLAAVAIAICLSAILAVSAVYAAYAAYRPVSFNAAEFSESPGIFDNPFRGFCHLYGFTLSDDDPSGAKSRMEQYISSGSLPLMLIQVNLKNYPDSPLSANALKQLDDILSAAEAARRQLIIRFLYDWDGKAAETEPGDISTIMKHMDQVSDIVNAHAESVFIIQGTFTGNCGEMNNSNYGSHDDNRALISRLAKAVSPSVYLSVRTPSQLRAITRSKNPVTRDTAYNGSVSSRLGLFNDGMLGSVYDLGTYDDTSNAGAKDPEEKGTRKEEIAFQNDICLYVPNGGEAVIDNPYNDLENAIRDMSMMRVTYLNPDHDKAVIDKWKSSVYRGGCFDGMSGYDYINAHLGYRYMISGAKISAKDISGKHVTAAVTIKNLGFAPAYRVFDGRITITGGGRTVTFPIPFDNRLIIPDDEETISVSAGIGALNPGTYKAYYSMNDPYTSLPVRFANVNDDGTGRIYLGEITIGKASLKKFSGYVWSRLRNR